VTCEERADQILAYAAGVAEPAEADDLRHHLATGCLVCAGRLAEARTMLATLPLSLEAQNPPALVRQRVMSGLAPASRESMPAVRPAPAMPMWKQIALPSLIAACVAATLTIFFNWRANSGRENDLAMQLSQSQETVRMLEAAFNQEQGQLDQVRLQNASWAADRDLRIVPLDPTALQPTAFARIFWDPTNRKWHFFATGLKSPPDGKQYELWAIASGTPPLAVAGFTPTDGDAAFITTLPVSMTPAAAAVTDEPAQGAVTAPTGSFQFKGAVNSQ
jgi:hypothetical protein